MRLIKVIQIQFRPKHFALRCVRAYSCRKVSVITDSHEHDGQHREFLPVTVIRDGLYELKSLEKLNISSNELLMELRQQGIEHRGQVRLGLVETDGDISLYFFEQKDLLPWAVRPAFRASRRI
ncbi:YetF domain-containing protein [Pseudomonas simiae]|uniref:YetF domain-containing protein n=1 Tax=Pseudomonas simiae TaxID=321846 RepID=UPI00269AFC6C